MGELTDQVIDLRPYARALSRALPWIVLAALLAGAAGYFFSTLQTPVYTANALIAVRQPRYTLAFDPRIQARDEDVRAVYDALPILAMSDELLSELMVQETIIDEENISIPMLHGSLETVPLAKPTLIQLSADNEDPQAAAEIVNAWARLLVKRANAIYAGQNSDQTEFFVEQVAAAEQELQDAQNALESFAAQNEGAVATAELEALLATQATYLENKGQVELLIQDAQSLLAQIETQPTGAMTSAADQLASLLLQVRAFGGQSETTSQVQLQLLPVDAQAEMSVGEQQAYLLALVDALTAKSAGLDQKVAEITPLVLSLQQQIQEDLTETTRLQDAVDIARDTHTILSRKTEEAGIAEQDGSGIVQLAGTAAVPRAPSAPNKPLNALAAGALGLLVGVVAVLFLHARSLNKTAAAAESGES